MPSGRANTIAQSFELPLINNTVIGQLFSTLKARQGVVGHWRLASQTPLVRLSGSMPPPLAAGAAVTAQQLPMGAPQATAG